MRSAEVARLIVEQFMTRTPIACSTTDTVHEVAGLMRDTGVGFVVVLARGRVVGVITDRQITVGVTAEGLDAREIPAEAIMTSEPATVTPEDPIFQVIDTMRGAGVVRRLPVVNDRHELVGVVSMSDLSVIAKDLIDAVLLEDTRHALTETRLPTGGKLVRKLLRSPTRTPRAMPTRVRTTSSVPKRRSDAGARTR